MLADELDYVVGVDTHRDQHMLSVVAAPTGAVVAQRSVRASDRGYAQALRFANEHAEGARAWAVEGAGHYGCGLARYLSRRGETVLEAGRSPRGERRLQGKDDGLDATRAARAAEPGIPARRRPVTVPGWSRAAANRCTIRAASQARARQGAVARGCRARVGALCRQCAP
jgi:transposase